MATIEQRAISPAPGVRVELFEADLTPLGGTTFYFHNYTYGSLFFQGNEYEPYPIRIEGLEYKTNGTLPEPHVFLSNVGSQISALLRAYGDCLGAKITRRLTLFEYLDDQPGADPTQEWPPDIYFIEQRASETNSEVEFVLKSAADIQNKQLPGRQMTSLLCRWVFRGPDCGYTGAPKTDEKGNAVTATTDRGAYNIATTYNLHDYVYVLLGGVRQYYASLVNANNFPLDNAAKWVRTQCSHRLTSGCKAHFGTTAPLPFGGFPGTARLPTSG